MYEQSMRIIQDTARNVTAGTQHPEAAARYLDSVAELEAADNPKVAELAEGVAAELRAGPHDFELLGETYTVPDAKPEPAPKKSKGKK